MKRIEQKNLGINCSSDFHVHVGQFYQHYYSPKNVVAALFECGVKKIIFSCASAGFTTNTKKDSSELHEFVQNEVLETLELCKNAKIESKAYLWVVPEFFQNGFTLESDFKTGLYSGIKLHPRTFFNRYDVKNQNIYIEESFNFAKKFNLPILLHTGIDENIDEPERFEDFFKRFPEVKVTLAHCRKYETFIKYFSKFPQLSGDTAFASEESIKAICNAGFTNRLFFGTDFPVTHYFNHREESAIENVSVEDLIADYLLCTEK